MTRHAANLTSLPAPARSAETIMTSGHAEQIDALNKLVEKQFRQQQALLQRLGGVAEAAPPRVVNLAPLAGRAPRSSWPQLSQRPALPDGWQHAPLPPVQPLIAAPGFQCMGDDRRITVTRGFTVFGLKGRDLDNVVAKLAAEQAERRDFRPVFFTDQTDFSAFTSRGYTVEYVPPVKSFWPADKERSFEQARRLYFIKWGLNEVERRDDARARDRQYPPLSMVNKHNGEMSRSCHADRFAWMAETLRISIATERFDVAADLANHLMVCFDRITPPQTQIAVARSICRKLIAFGEMDVLRRFLFKNHTRIGGDDYLYNLFAVHCSDANQFVPAFARLPSGKPNIHYLSRRLAAAGDQVLPLFLQTGDQALPQQNLLMANYFALTRQPELYRMFINRELGRNSGDQVRKLDLDADNVIASIDLERPRHVDRSGPLVSVIMSAYQSEATIGYAARSILAQSHGNLELLICDDDPNGSSLAALGSLRADPRVRLFRSKGQQGTYNIRNLLIAQAKGTHITFQDSDDLAFPSRIETQLKHLLANDAAAVAAQWYRVSGRGEFLISADQSASRLAVVSLLASRDVFAYAGPYRSARFGADTEYFERLRLELGNTAVLSLHTPLLFGLASDGSLTRQNGIEASEDGYRAPARRDYAAAAARARLLAWNSSGREQLDGLLKSSGHLLAEAGVVEVENRK